MRDWKTVIARRFAKHGVLDPATETEIVEELAEHFAQRESELVRPGASPDSIDARLEQELNELDLETLIAIRRRRTNAVPAVSMETRPTVSGWLDGLARDVIVGWRSLRRTLGVTTVIAVSLAIVLGANTAIFSLTDAMYLRRLDIPKAEQLTSVEAVRDGRFWSIPYSGFRSIRSAPGVPKMAGFRFEGVAITTDAGDEQRLTLELVTGEYFDLVGIKPLVGRTVSLADETNAAQVVVVSEKYWREHLGARADVLGQPLRVNDKVFTIIGVLPARFRGLHFAHQFQLAAPFTVTPMGFPDLRILTTNVVARFQSRSDHSPQRAALDAAIRACCEKIGALSSRDEGRASNLRMVQVDDPPYSYRATEARPGAGLAVQLIDASRGLTWGRELRARYKSAILVMVAAATLLLFVVCANVATLLLVRGEWRSREFAIRRSLGASVGRVRRQLFIEALEVSLLGGVLGLFLAWMITTLLTRALPPSARALGDVIAWRANTGIIAMTIGVTALCAIASSLWPARRAGRDELAMSLAGNRARGSGSWMGQRLLAIGQISAAMVLITAAWLMVATSRNLTRGAGGYGSRDVVLGQVSTYQIGDTATNGKAAIEDLRQDLLHLPGVVGAGYSYNAPLMLDGLMQSRVELPGSEIAGPLRARTNHVSPDFFSVSGAGMASGREFTANDDVNSERVAIVSQAFERRYYGHRSAIGMMIVTGEGTNRQSSRIVGVARDARYDRMAGSDMDLRNPETEMMYRPFMQRPDRARVATVIIRSELDPGTSVQQFRRAVARRKGMSIERVTTVGTWLDDGASRERFSAALATAFGALAVLLSAIGVLGVLAFQVARRTKEIGVRMALGAQRRDTVALVVRQTLGMLVTALVIGVPCAAAAAWVVRSQLYGVAPWDPRALLAAAGVILVVGFAASAVPSYRASRVDPLIALRQE
jgi:predicted permease